MIHPTLLKDCLHNLAPDTGSDEVYCKGLVVGIIAGLMSTGLTYEKAAEIVKADLPYNCRGECIPEAYKPELSL